MAQKVLHKRSRDVEAIPSLEFGEIAVNYSVQDPHLTIKDEQGNLITFSSDNEIANNLVNAIKNKSDVGHTHDDRYYTETEINTKLAGKSDTGHTHKKSEITDFAHTHKKSEITDFEHTHGTVTLTGDATGSANFTNTGTSITVTVKDDSHTHDGRYYTEPEVDAKIKAVNDTIANRYGFSNVKVGATTLAADSITDTVEFIAGDNIVLSAAESADTVTVGVKSGVFAPISHDHDYSEIKNTPTSLKNPNAITFTTGATTVGSYDGSTTATIKIPSSTTHLTNDSGWITVADKVNSAKVADSVAWDNVSNKVNATTATTGIAKLVEGDLSGVTATTAGQAASSYHTHSQYAASSHTHGTIKLQGDVTGSASFTNGGATIDATVTNNSHTHTSSNISDSISAGSGVTSGATALVQGKAVHEYAAPKSHTHGTVTLTGGATGSASFTNGGATIAVTIDSDKHSHDAKYSLLGHKHTSNDVTDSISAGSGVTSGATALVQGKAVHEYAQPKGNYAAKEHSHTITATANDDDVVVLTGTNGSNAVTYTASHATQGPNTAGNTATTDTTTAQSPTHGGKIELYIPKITVNKYGHVTSLSDQAVAVTLPSDNNTHYTTRIYAGASGTAANAATSNPYLKVTDDNTYRNQVRFVGGGATSIASNTAGTITITTPAETYTKHEDTSTLNGSYGTSSTNGSHAVKQVTVDALGHVTSIITGTTPDTKYSFSNGDVTLKWGTKSTIANVGGTDITVTMPANPDTNTHFISTNIVSSASTAAANAAATNGNVWLNHTEDGVVKSSHNIKGAGATTVTSDSAGTITISSTDTKYESLKNPYSLTIQRNGTTITTYDGSVAKTANISVPTKISDITNDLKSLTVGSKTYNGSAAVTITASDLGLAAALKYCGVTTTALSDGATTNPITINNASHTATAGCVVFYGDKEFVFNGTAWELLGGDATYKVVQSAVSSPSASGNATAFIDTIKQDTNGVITATKKNITTASTSAYGITKLSSATNSTSEALAATPKAVKIAYDKAATAQTIAEGKWAYNEDTIKAVKVNNATYADSAGTAVDQTARNAAATAQSTADGKWTAVTATTAATGIVKLVTGDMNGKAHADGQAPSLSHTHSQYASTGHTHSSYVNQNAFSNIAVGNTTIAADTTTDTLTLVAGANITLTPNTTGDSITITATDTVYTHPTTAGNKHIPSGGTSGQFLGWSADGTAQWVNNPNTDTATTQSGHYSPSATASTVGATSGNNYIRGIKLDSKKHVISVVTGTPTDTNTTYSAGSGLVLSNTTFSADGSAIINALGEGASPATREDYIVAQYAGGGTTTKTYHRRTLANIFAALNKSDITTALGYTPPTTDTNTWRGVQCNGTDIGSNTLNLKAGTNVSLSNSNGTITISSTDTNTDTKVTSVGNHYIPSSSTTKSASGGSTVDITATTTQVITGINVDAAGHVVSVVSKGLKATNTDTNTNTSHSHSAGVGLTGSGSAGTGSGTYTYKAKLKSETAFTVDSASATTNATTKIYPVAVDKSGYLSVYVPWTDTNTDTNNYLTGVSGSGNGTVTFTRQGLGSLTWNAGHSHSEYSGTGHTHSYLPLSGGTLSGGVTSSANITMKTNGGGIILDQNNGTTSIMVRPSGTTSGGNSVLKLESTTLNLGSSNYNTTVKGASIILSANTDVKGTLTINGSAVSTGYTLPTASSSTKGGIKVGSFLGISSEVLSVSTGTSSSTVARGDHSHSGVYQPAGSYLTSHQSVKFSVGTNTATTVATYTDPYINVWGNGEGTKDSVRFVNAGFLTIATNASNGKQISWKVNTGTSSTTVARGDHSHSGYLTEETYKGTVTSVKVTGGTGLSSGGTITSSGTITINHAAATTATTLNTSGANYYITGLTMDGLGHVTGISQSYDDNDYDVCSLSGHYNPSSSTTITAKTSGADYYVTGVTLNVDSKGHVTAMSVGSSSDDKGSTGSYLPLSGGTLTGTTSFGYTGETVFQGDIRLKTNNNNYNRKLYFGDGDYCYIHEYEDDHLKISVGDDAYVLTIGETVGPDDNSGFNFNSEVYALAFYQTSDEKLKDFGNDIEVDFDKLKTIPKKYFTWKDGRKEGVDLGTSAQKVRELYPEIVSGEKTLSVDYSKLSIIALKAVDKLHEENEMLKSLLAKMEERLSKLEENK